MTASHSTYLNSNAKIYVIRLHPHDDLKQSLQDFARQNKFRAAIILTCVGSLEQYNLRFANQKTAISRHGYFEIVSLVGTISATSCHLHISLADHTGATTGGHLMHDNRIYTTAEIAIAELPDLVFDRVTDPAYGYQELQIRSADNTLG